MHYLFKIQEKIVPELISIAENRYTILRNIYYNQPVGRRTLAEQIQMSERTVRNELKFLQSKGFVAIGRTGASLTRTGSDFLGELDKYIREIKGIILLEEEVARLLKINKVYIVPGNLEYSNQKQEIGRFAAQLIKELLHDGDVLAVTGGSTLAQVANSMPVYKKPLKVMVVPGRGGLGEEVEIQANTIAAMIAKKLGGNYQLLHIPDSIKEENVERIVAEPTIRKILQTLKRANILIHGIGSADEMARRRGMSPTQINDLIKRGAVGEAFGYYFNEKGEIVHTTTSIGLHLNDLQNIDQVIVVAGNPTKAKAIISVVSSKYHDLFITDELTAREIINLKGGG